MINAVEKQLSRFFKILLSNDIWIYECYFFFYAYFLMQAKKDLGWNAFIGNIIALNLLFFAPLVFVFFQEKLEVNTGKARYWLLWILAFVIVPRLVFFILPGADPSQLLSLSQRVSLGSFYDIDIQFLDIAITLLIIYWAVHLSRFQNRSGKLAAWLRNISFMKLAIIVVAAIALILPPTTNNFQEIAADLSAGEVFWLYVKSVPQVFVIYFSYYVFYYLNHHYLFKLIFEKKGVFAYIISLIGLILILTPILNSLFLLFPVINQLRIHPLGIGINLFDDINYIFPILVVIFSFPIIVLIEWNRKSIAMKELARQKSNAELSLLKQQINPHFFFNTLNNLYALSLDKSDQAPETILKLSKLMRFVIYKGQQDKVLLEEEIQYVQDYIDLQKLRMRKDVDISFDINVVSKDLEIPPLLFINLVENAFKHGIEPSEKSGFLRLSLIEESGRIVFTCVNSVEEGISVNNSEGIGIANLKKRLEIRFPSAHKLELKKSEAVFTAILEAEL